MIAKTGPSSLCVLIFKTKAFLMCCKPYVVRIICQLHPPLSVAADHNRHLNIFCIALITYLFFTGVGTDDSSEQYTVVGTRNTDKFLQLLDN